MAKFEEEKKLWDEYFKNREFSPINANKWSCNHTNFVISLFLHENYHYCLLLEVHLTHNRSKWPNLKKKNYGMNISKIVNIHELMPINSPVTVQML